MISFDRFYGRSSPAFGGEPSSEVCGIVPGRVPENSPALDLGCGDGRNSLFLAARGFQVTAVDSSQVGVTRLLERARLEGLERHLQGIVADVCEWDYPRARYDLIIAITILDHLPAEAIGGVCARLLDSARPGATLLVKVHTVADPGYRGVVSDKSELADAIEHYFEPGELRKLLKDCCRLDYYEERRELDTSHGEPHHHGFAIATAVKVE